MKKVLIASAFAALFAACSNTPAVSESATKVEGLAHWVDSIKAKVEADTMADSATWANYATEFEAAASTIKVEELDEATKGKLDAAKTAWTNVGTTYSSKIAAIKEAAMKANQTVDSTAAAIPTPAEAGQTIIEKGKEAAKAGIDKGANAMEKKMK